MHRFFAPSLDPGDERVVLPKEEAEHLTRVLRLGAGDVVSVFDGRGHEFLGRVVRASRRDVEIALIEPCAPARESRVAITLAQAVLKAEKMDDVVRDAVMLGISALQPIVSARAETTVASLARGGRLDRWKRIALASAKQSRRAVLPEIQQPLTLENYLDDRQAEVTLMLVEPSAQAAVAPLASLRSIRPPASVELIVGPEGGWTSEEWRAAQSKGITLLSLGDRTLRADAVPIAVLSVLQFLWDG